MTWWEIERQRQRRLYRNVGFPVAEVAVGLAPLPPVFMPGLGLRPYQVLSAADDVFYGTLDRPVLGSG